MYSLLPGRDVPLVRTPKAIPAHERAAHLQLGRRLFTELCEERIDDPTGVTWRLPANEFPVVASFLANERRCCPFIRVEVHIEPGSESMWLRLSGPPGAREALDAELGLRVSNSCGCA